MDIQIFFFFFGTITIDDTLGRFLPAFCTPEWRDLNNRWIAGEFGSKVCFTEQFKLANIPDEATLLEFLGTIKIQPDFAEFYDFTKIYGIDFYVVSDGMDFFIKTILKNHGIENIKFFSNILKPDFTLEFPNHNTNCKRQAATCKCSVIERLQDPDKTLIYIGDGISDFCGAQKADIVFAKGALLRHCRQNGFTNVVEFKSFSDISKQITDQAACFV
jgi:2,3-diketo-5-methylthio-1-phosphopentane phosphatase